MKLIDKTGKEIKVGDLIPFGYGGQEAIVNEIIPPDTDNLLAEAPLGRVTITPCVEACSYGPGALALQFVANTDPEAIPSQKASQAPNKNMIKAVIKQVAVVNSLSEVHPFLVSLQVILNEGSASIPWLTLGTGTMSDAERRILILDLGMIKEDLDGLFATPEAKMPSFETCAVTLLLNKYLGDAWRHVDVLNIVAGEEIG